MLSKKSPGSCCALGGQEQNGRILELFKVHLACAAEWHQKQDLQRKFQGVVFKVWNLTGRVCLSRLSIALHFLCKEKKGEAVFAPSNMGARRKSCLSSYCQEGNLEYLGAFLECCKLLSGEHLTVQGSQTCRCTQAAPQNSASFSHLWFPVPFWSGSGSRITLPSDTDRQ